MDALLWFGITTAAGTAVLTVAAVWKLLMGPLNAAIQSIKDSVVRLESRIESNDTKHESDIKDLWKYLAERSLRE